MGRKIPAKKHRGVKDPLKQQEQRFQSIKDKINAPPTDPDEQPIPKSLQRLFAFKEPRTPASIVKKKKSRSIAGRKRDDNPVAALQRMPGEAGRAFSLRINSAVRALHNTDQEDYPLDLEETDTRGEYIASQRERRQKKHRQAVAKESRKEGTGTGGGERLTKGQRRTLKRKELQKAKDAESKTSRELAARELRYERVAFGDVAHAPPALSAPRRAQPGPGAPRSKTSRELAARELRYERVAFGDVAHAPPALSAPRRAQPGPGAPRPGRRDLLLASMLKPNAQPSQSETQPSKAKTQKAQLSTAEQLRRERARLEAVDAYRALKKQRAVEKANR